MLWAPHVAAQTDMAPDAWRALATRLEPGTAVKMRLHNGQRFDATLVVADADGLVVQPMTRRVVPVQRVAYTAIASMQRRDERGVGAAKAALIGVGTGVAAGLAVLMLLIAAYSD
jgi:hypothetical protein